jgi:hypothetical protein
LNPKILLNYFFCDCVCDFEIFFCSSAINKFLNIGNELLADAPPVSRPGVASLWQWPEPGAGPGLG